jgi:transcriptional antiterminator NusG
MGLADPAKTAFQENSSTLEVPPEPLADQTDLTQSQAGAQALPEESEPPKTAAETDMAPPAQKPPGPPSASEPGSGLLAPSNKNWYVVKVQSGREESIKEAIERRVKIEGLEEYFAQIVIPVEKVVEMRNNKRVVRDRKLFPGYLMVEVEFNDRILYLFRETSGVGDFVGAGLNRAPTPMTPREVERMLRKGGAEPSPEPKIGKPPVDRGDRVKVKDGTFAGMEGEVKEVIEAKNQVRVELIIFGRPVPVDLEYWQVETI